MGVCFFLYHILPSWYTYLCHTVHTVFLEMILPDWPIQTYYSKWWKDLLLTIFRHIDHEMVRWVFLN